MIIDLNDPHPYDTMFKRSMEIKEVARDFLELIIPEEIQFHLDLEDFTLEKNDFIDNNLGKGFVDILFSVKIKNKSSYISVFIEIQSKLDRFMPTRVHKYKSLIYESHRKKYPKSKNVPIIFSTVFYLCKRSKTMPRTIMEMVEHSELAKIIHRFENNELYLHEMSDEKIMQKENTAPVMILTKHAKDGDFMSIMKRIADLLSSMSRKNELYFQDCFMYTLKVGAYKNSKEIIEFFRHLNIPEKQKEQIMNIAQRLVQEGRAEGRAEGAINAKFEIAKMMIAEGYNLETVSHLTGVSIRQLKNLY